VARAAAGDSAWVVAVGTARVIGSVKTEWRDDLPFVAPDGVIALADKDDVRFVDGETLRQRSVVDGGGRDFWHVIVWNDPVNLMSYVVFVFMRVLGFTKEKATKHMLEVHNLGKSVVATETREKAELYHQQIQSHGLQVTLENAS